MGLCCSKTIETEPLKPGEPYNKNLDYQRAIDAQDHKRRIISQATSPNALMYFYDPLTGTYIPSENMDKTIPSGEWHLGYH